VTDLKNKKVKIEKKSKPAFLPFPISLTTPLPLPLLAAPPPPQSGPADPSLALEFPPACHRILPLLVSIRVEISGSVL
jgi:hypothetical protein